jgi:uncharacterized membrane protein
MNMIEKFNELFFSPLGKEYCNYFYMLSLFSLIIVFVTVVRMVIELFLKSKNKVKHALDNMAFIINFLVIYFINRLFYTMCIN